MSVASTPSASDGRYWTGYRARSKFGFDLFGLCVMSNHVHYLIRPARPEDMPRLMHWLNWYSAMLLNRLLRRRGHFWERRYQAVA